MAEYHLAHFNVARPREPLSHAAMHEFVANLERVNEAAHGSPGFLWDFTNPNGPDGPMPGFDDAYVVVNLSVWASVDALKDYVYKGLHGDFFRRRAAWFEKPDRANYVLWWVAAGHRPDTLEARGRLDSLRERGPTPDAFDFRKPFPAPGAAVAHPG